MSPPRSIGIGLGRIGQWHDGIGEFVRRYAQTLAARAPMLREREGWQFTYHLPRRWHGLFGDDVRYLDVHDRHRWLHRQPETFDLWHNVHLRSRVATPWSARRRVETVHDLIFLHAARGRLQLAQRRWFARRRLQVADAAVAISHHVAAEMQRALAPLHAPVSVVHNGVLDAAAAPRREVAELDGTRFLLHISRMSPNKNVGTLLDLAEAWPEQAFVFAGQRNAHTVGVQQAIARRGLANATLLFDVDDETRTWLYAHCIGFLFPSLDEGFGLPPIEAMYFGKPVFLSRLTSLPEVGGEVAHYFDDWAPASMRAVVEAGLRAAAEPGAAERLRAHAQTFTWDRCIDGYLALYRRLLLP
ncbi:MAG: glycosyltransferase family 4 protein [Rubrivivax sp.]|nr:glycosyltransferase family 4 protein [Rubrivivax sp.]